MFVFTFLDVFFLKIGQMYLIFLSAHSGFELYVKRNFWLFMILPF